MVVEIVLDGRGAVRIEADLAVSARQIKALIDHAADTLMTNREPKAPEGYGFGAGPSTVLDRGSKDQDPYEFGQVIR